MKKNLSKEQIEKINKAKQIKLESKLIKK